MTPKVTWQSSCWQILFTIIKPFLIQPIWCDSYCWDNSQMPTVYHGARVYVHILCIVNISSTHRSLSKKSKPSAQYGISILPFRKLWLANWWWDYTMTYNSISFGDRFECLCVGKMRIKSEKPEFEWQAVDKRVTLSIE